MQVAAVYRHEIVMRSRFRSSGGQNDKRRRSSSAAKERLMRKCSELCIRGNRCGKMRPQSATFLYSIKDSSDVDDTCNCGSYYGIIEVGSSYASSLVDHFHDASPWRTTLENVRNMNLDGKYVSLTNISATCTNAPNKSWVDVARAFHESGAKSVQYKNMWKLWCLSFLNSWCSISTKNLSKGSFTRKLLILGERYGGDVNAMTNTSRVRKKTFKN